MRIYIGKDKKRLDIKKRYDKITLNLNNCSNLKSIVNLIMYKYRRGDFNMEKLLKKETGITLIALIISIIVLLILAGVSIAMLTGEDAIIENAQLASTETKAATIEENKFMWQMERLMAQQEGNPVKSLDEFLQELKEEGVLTEEEVNIIKASENKEITIGSRTISFNIENDEEETVTVTFYDEDKTTILDTVMVEKGETAIYTANIPTKPSKVFSYWVTENGTKANLENITENLNVYAYYTSSVCFVAGTKVLTEEGLINIEEIKIGTKVYSMNEETGEIELKLVKNTFKNLVDKNMCKVYINGEVIESTSGHTYYEVNKGWIKASELEKGDTLLKKDGNKIIVDELEIIEFNGNLNTVYNIEVEDNHNYFVGENSVLVHNPKHC